MTAASISRGRVEVLAGATSGRAAVVLGARRRDRARPESPLARATASGRTFPSVAVGGLR